MWSSTDLAPRALVTVSSEMAGLSLSSLFFLIACLLTHLITVASALLIHLFIESLL